MSAFKDKIQVLRLPDRSPMGIAAYEEKVYETYRGKHILLLHPVCILPASVLDLSPPDVLKRIRETKGARSIADLSFKEFQVTYFAPTRPYFFEWIDIEGVSQCKGFPSPKDTSDMQINAQRIVNYRITHFRTMFAQYERWLKHLQIFIARELTESPRPNLCEAKATILMVAEVDPSDVVQQAARTGLFEIVEEKGTRRSVKSYVNVAALVKTREFQEWMRREKGEPSKPGPNRDIFQGDSGGNFTVLPEQGLAGPRHGSS